MPSDYVNPIHPNMKYQVVKTKKMKMIYSQQFNRSSRGPPAYSFVGAKHKNSSPQTHIKSDPQIDEDVVIIGEKRQTNASTENLPLTNIVKSEKV